MKGCDSVTESVSPYCGRFGSAASEGATAFIVTKQNIESAQENQGRVKSSGSSQKMLSWTWLVPAVVSAIILTL